MRNLKEITADGNIKEEYESTRDYMQDYVHHNECRLTITNRKKDGSSNSKRPTHQRIHPSKATSKR
jgi:hypothetical protein